MQNRMMRTCSFTATSPRDTHILPTTSGFHSLLAFMYSLCMCVFDYFAQQREPIGVIAWACSLRCCFIEEIASAKLFWSF